MRDGIIDLWEVNSKALVELVSRCKSNSCRVMFTGRNLSMIRSSQLLFMDMLDFKGDLLVPDKDTCDVITTIFKYNNVLNSDDLCQGATNIAVLRIKDGWPERSSEVLPCNKHIIDIRSFKYTVDESINRVIEGSYLGFMVSDKSMSNVIVKLDNNGTIYEINYYN